MSRDPEAPPVNGRGPERPEQPVRLDFPPEPPINVITAFVVYMELDGRVRCTANLGGTYHFNRLADSGDMLTCVAKIHSELQAVSVAEALREAL